MRICIPIDKDLGLDSPICGHFGSAPFFLIADTESGELRALANGGRQHAPGQCNPLASLSGERIDGLVVANIGMGALAKFAAAGVAVFKGTSTSVRDTLAALRQGALAKVDPAGACAGHGHHPVCR